jgi:hypothetical protein
MAAASLSGAYVAHGNVQRVMSREKEHCRIGHAHESTAKPPAGIDTNTDPLANRRSHRVQVCVALRRRSVSDENGQQSCFHGSPTHGALAGTQEDSHTSSLECSLTSELHRRRT